MDQRPVDITTNADEYLRRCVFQNVDGIAHAVDPRSRQLRAVFIKRHPSHKHLDRLDPAWVSPMSELSFEQKSGFAPLMMTRYADIEGLRAR